jgi:hypothetical protein
VFMTTGAAWGETPTLMCNKLHEAKVSFSLLPYAMVEWFCSHIPVLAWLNIGHPNGIF